MLTIVENNLSFKIGTYYVIHINVYRKELGTEFIPQKIVKAS